MLYVTAFLCNADIQPKEMSLMLPSLRDTLIGLILFSAGSSLAFASTAPAMTGNGAESSSGGMMGPNQGTANGAMGNNMGQGPSAMGNGSTGATMQGTNPGGAQSGMPMNTPSTGPHVSHRKLHDFAAAIKDIQPIDQKAHKVLTDKSLSENARKAKLTSYDQEIVTILHRHHLSPVDYETLLRKAQTDPNFAKRTEAALRSMH
ncbi:DUF4168 domain-containing protein [Acidithiobacillus sp.]|uniref:DUF4168 domain-containing protein n=1 Tax=Acidithiobacillus sp. TaxID=1872118 RepID=UPI0025BDFD15|nr:DUF4168 domain-containing protein [Acidithiobacillus sp.]